MERLDNERVPEDPQKLNEQILQAREQRRRVEAEFDAFTNSFQRRPAQPDAPIVPAPRAADIHQQIQFEPHAAAPSLDTNEPDVVREVPQASVAPPRARARERRGLIIAAIGVALAVALGAAMVAMRGREQAPDVVRPDAATAAAADTTTSSPNVPQTTVAANPPVASAPAPAAVAASGVNIEIATRRRVWMRVTLDGNRAFEREVAGDQKIPLHAARSIVIRVGDAGAVAVTRDGRAVGPLGRDGVIATREFSAKPRS
jgi:hypothetical protein